MRQTQNKDAVLTAGNLRGAIAFIVLSIFDKPEVVIFGNYNPFKSVKEGGEIPMLEDSLVILTPNRNMTESQRLDMAELGRGIENQLIKEGIALALEMEQQGAAAPVNVVRKITGIPVNMKSSSNPEDILVELQRVKFGLTDAKEVQAHPIKLNEEQWAVYKGAINSAEITFTGELNRIQEHQKAMILEQLNAEPQLDCTAEKLDTVEAIATITKQVEIAKKFGRLVQSKVEVQSMPVADAIVESFRDIGTLTGKSGIELNGVVPILNKVEWVHLDALVNYFNKVSTVAEFKVGQGQTA